MRTVLAATAAVFALSACGDDSGGGSWPNQLYLAPLDSELTLQLQEEQPFPF